MAGTTWRSEIKILNISNVTTQSDQTVQVTSKKHFQTLPDL